MTGPLEGLRVIDCTSGTAGPRATGILADHGADVIWVERPGGDPWREQQAVLYSVANRGKRSIVLDLRDPEGRAALHGLAARADVVVTSGRPGSASSLGLDPEQLREVAPQAVVCAISGFGLDGPWRDVPGYEALVHALVGTTGEQVGHRPGPIFEGLPFASIGAGYLGAIGVVAALHRRARTGVGRVVETSLLDGALAYLSMLWGEDARGNPASQPGSARILSKTFRCADDEFLGLHTGAVGGFSRMLELLELTEEIPTNDSGLDMGQPLAPELAALLHQRAEERLASADRATWLGRLWDADICAMPALRPGQVFDEPQVRHNGVVAVVDDPVLGPVEQIGPALRFFDEEEVPLRAAPRVDEHRAAVLALLDEPLAGRAPWPGVAPVADDDPSEPLLAGLKVVDFGAYFAGPFASRLLGDLGADVIKLEPLGGDQMRGVRRVFQAANVGKRSVAANLKHDELAPLAAQLARWADVVQHNLRPGAPERLGLGYEQLRAVNPDLVYLQSPGWGSTGPWAGRQSFAPIMSGYVGACFEVAGAHNDPLFPVGNEDPGNGLLGAFATLVALLRRTQRGHGQRVENPQLHAALSHVAHIVRRPDGEVLGALTLDPLQMGTGPFERLYETADGWVCVAAPGLEDAARLLHALDLPVDERVASRVAVAEHAYELEGEVAKVMASTPSAEVVERLTAAGVGAVVPMVGRNDGAFLAAPEHQASRRAGQAVDPDLGWVRGVGTMVRAEGLPVVAYQRAPGLGEHTDEVLDELGWDRGRVAELRAAGQVR